MPQSAPPTGHTLSFPNEMADSMAQVLQREGFALEQAQHAHWRARGEGCTITFYRSGKVVLQGRAADNFVELFGPEAKVICAKKSSAPKDNTSDSVPAIPYAQALSKHPSPAPGKWIGTDESGKGDYFGPLVVAGVLLPRQQLELLAALGVKDSKAIRDKSVLELAPQIRQVAIHSVVSIGPKRYNQLRTTMKNLNRMLAWGHARVIENLLQSPQAEGCNYALSDQFGDKELIQRALMEHGKKIILDQRPRAEEDPAVACASILAREQFLRAMKALGSKYHMMLPKGAGPPVLKATKDFVEKYGEGALSEVAKVHFATTANVIGHPLAQ